MCSDAVCQITSRFLQLSTVTCVTLQAAQVLYGIDHHAGADGDQQNIRSDAHVTVAGGREANFYDQLRRQFIENDLAWQRTADVPFFCLTGRHAAVVFLGQTGRAESAAMFVRVVVAHVRPMRVFEMRAMPCG